MLVRLLRHATLLVTMHGLRILVDPMLSAQGAMEPIAQAGNDWRIPMVPLPLTDAELTELLQQVDAVLVTHTHRDHWDEAAQKLLPVHLPVFCQPEDQRVIAQAGFSHVQPVQETTQWRGLQIVRTGGVHGHGELGQKMGPVSGFVLTVNDEPSLYIAGDTVWCPIVEQALERYAPDIVVLNAGAASYVTGGGPITMHAEDVCLVCRSRPAAQVVAVHMETVNHCLLTRAALRERLDQEGWVQQVLIPGDGDGLQFAR